MVFAGKVSMGYSSPRLVSLLFFSCWAISVQDTVATADQNRFDGNRQLLWKDSVWTATSNSRHLTTLAAGDVRTALDVNSKLNPQGQSTLYNVLMSVAEEAEHIASALPGRRLLKKMRMLAAAPTPSEGHSMHAPEPSSQHSNSPAEAPKTEGHTPAHAPEPSSGHLTPAEAPTSGEHTPVHAPEPSSAHAPEPSSGHSTPAEAPKTEGHTPGQAPGPASEHSTPPAAAPKTETHAPAPTPHP